MTDAFTAERPRLFGLAYRILGSVVDAEDVVQEAWLRWAGADRTAIERPAAWLTTVTTRLALDRLKAVRRRREDYVGPWLPEPIVVEPGPERQAEAAETLTLGFLAALETLDPVARVVFLLTDVFGCPSDEVAATVGRSPAACRQLAARSRAKLRSARPQRPSPTDRLVVDQLLAAVAAGDTAAAVALLSEGVVLVADGGPLRHAARHPIIGSHRVSRFLCNVAKRLTPGLLIEPVTLNGAPGISIEDPGGEQDAGMAFEVRGGVVSAVWIVTAPDKLAGLRRPANLI